MDTEQLKRSAGYLAASFVEKHMKVGLGTGSTAYYFIERLIQRNREENLEVQVLASSLDSLALAKAGGLSLLDSHQLTSLDLTIDGADEIDSQKRMIKGGGGALLREKILASMSKELVIIIDESKQVEALGRRKLPIEVLPFGSSFVLQKLQNRGLSSQFRLLPTGERVLTDNGNHLIDIHFPFPIQDPEKEHAELKAIPGVLETGFFFHLAGRVVIAFSDGQTITLP